MITIGVDVGLNGALGALNPDGSLLGVWDLPYIRDGAIAMVDPVEIRSWYLREIPGHICPVRFMVERQAAMPKMNVSAVFNFGVGFGSLLAAIRALDKPVEFVQPRVWKGALGLAGKTKSESATKAKRAALDKARLLFPTADLQLSKHEGRGEALLIAHWACRYQPPRSAVA